MNIYDQLQFLKGVHFRSIGVSIMGNHQTHKITAKILRDVRKAQKENAELDNYIYNSAKIALRDLEPDEIPF